MCKRTRRAYVGSSRNIRTRYLCHLSTAKRIRSRFSKAILQIGEFGFHFGVIERCESSALEKREQYWIDKYQPFGDRGFNVIRKSFCRPHVGDAKKAISAARGTEEARKNQSVRSREYFSSKEIRKKFSDRMSTPEAKATQSEISKKRFSSPESRERMSKALKDYFATEQGKETIKRSQKTKWSKPENKIKAAACMLRYRRTPEAKAAQILAVSRPVVQLSLASNEKLSEFPSLKDASRKTGICHESICCAASGKNKTAGGFRWVYLESFLAGIIPEVSVRKLRNIANKGVTE